MGDRGTENSGRQKALTNLSERGRRKHSIMGFRESWSLGPNQTFGTEAGRVSLPPLDTAVCGRVERGSGKAKWTRNNVPLS